MPLCYQDLHSISNFSLKQKMTQKLHLYFDWIQLKVKRIVRHTANRLELTIFSICSVAPEERQQDVRQTIESRPLFGPSGSHSSKRTANQNPFVKNSRLKSESQPLTRQNLGVSFKSKELLESSEDATPKQSSSTASSANNRLILCDYTSSSSSGEDS